MDVLCAVLLLTAKDVCADNFNPAVSVAINATKKIPDFIFLALEDKGHKMCQAEIMKNKGIIIKIKDYATRNALGI